MNGVPFNLSYLQDLTDVANKIVEDIADFLKGHSDLDNPAHRGDSDTSGVRELCLQAKVEIGYLRRATAPPKPST
jgi:hypothetical protein